MNKIITEKEITLLIKKSLKEIENSQEIEVIKKNYLEKGGIISQVLQQIAQETDPEKKKKIGTLVNN